MKSRTRVMFWRCWLIGLFIGFFAGSAMAGERRKFDFNVTAVKVGNNTDAKSTRVSTKGCLGIPMDEVFVDAQPFTVVAVPEFCELTGFSIYENFLWTNRKLNAGGFSFHLLTRVGDIHVAPVMFSPERGYEVLVFDTTPIEFSVGNVSVSANPFETYLSAKIAGTTWATRSTRNCTPSGCEAISTLTGQVLILDKEFSVPPGTAVIDSADNLVGMVLGADKGRTVVVSMMELFNLMCSVLDCKA